MRIRICCTNVAVPRGGRREQMLQQSSSNCRPPDGAREHDCPPDGAPDRTWKHDRQMLVEGCFWAPGAKFDKTWPTKIGPTRVNSGRTGPTLAGLGPNLVNSWPTLVEFGVRRRTTHSHVVGGAANAFGGGSASIMWAELPMMLGCASCVFLCVH